MNKKELKKFITTLSNEELQQELIKLFEKFDQVKHYYTAELSSDTDTVLSKYKQRIEKEFQRASARSSNSFRTSEINNIIKEFEKVTVFTIDIIELKIYRIQLAINYIKDFRIDNQTFHGSVVGHYQKAITQIHANKLEDHFADKIDNLKAMMVKYHLMND